MKIFNHVKLKELDFDLTSETTEKGRYYQTPEGNIYPSVTTILSEFNKDVILNWKERVGEEQANKISRLAASRGTKLHTVCENYLLNEMTSFKIKTLMPDTKALFIKLKPKIDSSLDNVYAIEQALYSNILKTAGRVDCIAEWDGELSVIDFKTSSKLKKEEYIENYFMQCTIYTHMFEEIVRKPINRIVVVIAVENEEPQIFVKDKRFYLEQTVNFINNYHLTRQTT